MLIKIIKEYLRKCENKVEKLIKENKEIQANSVIRQTMEEWNDIRYKT